MKKSPTSILATLLAKDRWAKTSKKERVAHSAMMNKARWNKIKERKKLSPGQSLDSLRKDSIIKVGRK